MPNYCHCVIKVYGKKKYMKKFYKTITDKNKNKKLTFQKTVPLTQNENIDECTRFWGTKWDIGSDDDEVLKNNELCYIVRCNTAWNPPIEWAITASTKFMIAIRIAYIECGLEFYGVFKVDPYKLFRKQANWGFLKNDCQYDEETDEEILSDKLKNFMTKYDLISLGG